MTTVIFLLIHLTRISLIFLLTYNVEVKVKFVSMTLSVPLQYSKKGLNSFKKFFHKEIYLVFFINPFHVPDIFLYPLKTSKNLWLSDFLGGIERDQWHEMC